MAGKKKARNMNVWHRTMLDILKAGKCDTESLVDKMIERKAYHSRATIKGYISALSGWGFIEDIETERAKDTLGRMTIRIWRLSKKSSEITGEPVEIEEVEVEEEEDFGLSTQKKNHGRLMNIWHRAFVDILKDESPLSKNEMIKRVRERGAYQSPETLRGYVTELKNYGLIEAVEDVRVADENGRMTIPIWKLVEAPESSPETAKVNQPTEGEQ